MRTLMAALVLAAAVTGCVPAGGHSSPAEDNAAAPASDGKKPDGQKSNGQKKEPDPVIAFPSGDFTPPPGERTQPSLAKRARAPGRPDRTYALILLEGRLSGPLRRDLEKVGVRLVGAYPTAAHRVDLPLASLEKVAALPGLRWIGQPTPEQKIAMSLLPLLRNPGDGASISLHLHLFTPEAWGRARPALETLGIRVQRYEPSLGLVTVTAEARALPQILALDSVLYVEPVAEVHVGGG